MNRLVLLVEERSMKVLLDELIPRFFPECEFMCVAHEGKRDLQKSVPRKLKAWREPGIRFIIVQDNDGGDCKELKTKLSSLCRAAGRHDALVRIVCQELEAWYFGDLKAAAMAFDRRELLEARRKSRYRAPDAIPHPSREFQRLVPEYQKISGARAMARHMALDSNKSPSFCALMNAIQSTLAGSS